MASVKPWGLRHFVLSNGVEIPCVGFGTFKIRGETNVRAAVSFAVGTSRYRLIDTAAVYKNESFIAGTLESIFSGQEPRIKVS